MKEVKQADERGEGTPKRRDNWVWVDSSGENTGKSRCALWGLTRLLHVITGTLWHYCLALEKVRTAVCSS